jgi:hypothetical protein
MRARNLGHEEDDRDHHGATPAAVRLTANGKAWPIIPPQRRPAPGRTCRAVRRRALATPDEQCGKPPATFSRALQLREHAAPRTRPQPAGNRTASRCPTIARSRSRPEILLGPGLVRRTSTQSRQPFRGPRAALDADGCCRGHRVRHDSALIVTVTPFLLLTSLDGDRRRHVPLLRAATGRGRSALSAWRARFVAAGPAFLPPCPWWSAATSWSTV